MADRIIITNISGSDRTLLLGMTVAASEVVELTDFYTRDEIESSKALKDDVSDGLYSVSDGTRTLTTVEALAYLAHESQLEDDAEEAALEVRIKRFAIAMAASL